MALTCNAHVRYDSHHIPVERLVVILVTTQITERYLLSVSPNPEVNMTEILLFRFWVEIDYRNGIYSIVRPLPFEKQIHWHSITQRYKISIRRMLFTPSTKFEPFS